MRQYFRTQLSYSQRTDDVKVQRNVLISPALKCIKKIHVTVSASFILRTVLAITYRKQHMHYRIIATLPHIPAINCHPHGHVGTKEHITFTFQSHIY
jgi:hypothetical protein